MGGELVAIGGREFELGAVYAPRDRGGRGSAGWSRTRRPRAGAAAGWRR